MQKKFSKIFYLYLTRALSHFFIFIICIFLPQTPHCLGQTIVDEIKAVSIGEVPLKNQVFSETISTISSNKRIFIITNSNQKLIMGDFVSFIIDDELVARALVVKTRDDRSGLKLVKIYSQGKWSSLTTGMNINIIRGDDSYYLSQLKKERESILSPSTETAAKTSNSLDLGQRDLTSDEALILGSEFNLDNNKSHLRKLDADHLLYFTVGNMRSLGAEGSEDTYLHYRFGWGYQVFNNWFTDISYGHSTIKKYPASDIDTSLNTITIKFGYIFQLPVHSFLYAYGGLYNNIAIAPGAGEGVSDAQAQDESEKVRDLEGIGYLGGISFYKRLVPGWTFKIDADLKNVGAGIMVEI